MRLSRIMNLSPSVVKSAFIDEVRMSAVEIVVLFRSPEAAHDLLPRFTSKRDGIAPFVNQLRPLFSQNQSDTVPSDMPSQALSHAIDEMRRYFVALASDSLADAIVRELASEPGVEAVYSKPLAENPLAPYTDESARPSVAAAAVPDFTSQQEYLEAAPGGIDAKYAWHFPGGDGDRVAIVDVEGGWQLSHLDLAVLNGGLIGGTPYPEASWRNHGTAVLAEMGADKNGFGVTGISYGAIISAVSHGSIGSAKAIQLAAQRLKAGDIILLEMHRAGPRNGFQSNPNQKGYIGVEWWPDDLLAIQYATANGIIVVEAAGNGAENLDDALYDQRGPGFPAGWKNPFRDAGISGAIMVGAGAPPSGLHGRDRSRLDFSNFGQRVDCQGWGRGVVTAGYGDLFSLVGVPEDEDNWYTARFSGTSSASPIVAGAIACLQGIACRRGPPVSPARIRAALHATGSPQLPDGAERIGNRPNLRQLIDYLLPHAFSPTGIVNMTTLDLPLPSAPTGVPMAAAFSVSEFEDKPTPDFEGRLHTQFVPPNIIGRISVVPALPKMRVVWAWNSPGFEVLQIHHRASILYNEHGRNDSSQQLQFSNRSLTSELDFGAEVFGGTLSCYCSIAWRRISDGATGQTGEGIQQFGILADNPSRADIRMALGTVELQVIGYKESRFYQFDNASLPLFGPPNGFGIMQIDNPRPTARQLWDWRQNISAGTALFAQKKLEVTRHFKNIYDSDATIPKLTSDEAKLALYQYYNGGWYWDWDVSAKAWKKVGTTSYGDEALRIEKLVAAGTPPGDWN